MRPEQGGKASAVGAFERTDGVSVGKDPVQEEGVDVYEGGLEQVQGRASKCRAGRASWSLGCRDRRRSARCHSRRTSSRWPSPLLDDLRSSVHIATHIGRARPLAHLVPGGPRDGDRPFEAGLVGGGGDVDHGAVGDGQGAAVSGDDLGVVHNQAAPSGDLLSLLIPQ